MMDISRKVTSRIKLRQLQLIVAIYDMKTLCAASETIGMSQPAATQSLRELEDALDCELFIRNNRGVIPTEYGEALVRHARNIISQVRHAGEELSDLVSGIGGRIVVGTLISSSALLLPEAIIRLRKTRPNIIIKVIEGTNDILIPSLLRGEIDIVVGRLPEQEYCQGTKQIFLYNEEGFIFVAPENPLAQQSSITLKDLNACDWILPPIETTLRSQLEKAFFDVHLKSPRCVIESVSWLTNKYLWRNTNLVGVAPAYTVKRKIKRGDLVRLSTELDLKIGPVGISVQNNGNLSSIVQFFIEELQSVGKEFIAQIIED